MTTVTYQVHHWTHEDTGAGDCFEVIECMTIHAVTGDEYSECGVASFGAMEDAQSFIQEVLSKAQCA